jgi:hypothetical protein
VINRLILIDPSVDLGEAGIDPFTGSSTHVAHHLDGRKQLSKDPFPTS